MRQGLIIALALASILGSAVACGSAFAPRTRTPFILTPTAAAPRVSTLAPSVTASPAAPTLPAAPAFPASSPTTRLLPTPTSVTFATPLPADKRVVGNTGGSGGANLRQTPDGALIKTYPEGTIMTLLGAEERAGGRLWLKVQTPSGETGWMLAIVLLITR
jgi:hypothetical protein